MNARLAVSVVLTVAGAAGAADRAPMPPAGNGYKLFWEGNSLMGQLHCRVHLPGGKPKTPLIVALCRAFGYPETSTETVGAAGVPIDWAWENDGKRKEFFEKIPGTKWDLLIVQPFGFQNTRRPEDEAAAAAQIYRLILDASPKAALLVYQTWPSGKAAGELADGGGNAEAYAAGLARCIDTHMDPVTHILRQEFPDRPVYAIPVPRAFLEFHKRIEAGGGTWQGFRHVAQLLDQGGASVHVSPLGLYVNAMVHLGSYFRKAPAGGDLPNEYGVTFAFDLKKGAQPTGLSRKQAEALQALAWDVVRTSPATPVSARPFDFPDMTAPKPAKLGKVDVLAARQARVRWSAATDDTAVVKQSLYLNDEYLDTVDANVTSYVVAGLRPGEANRFRIRAFDACHNLADAVATITPPKLTGPDVLLGWDLFPYTNNPKDRDPDTYRPAEAVTATSAPGTRAGPATIRRGPGLRGGTRPFRHCMLFWGPDAETLGEAIEAGSHLSFTVAPAEGKTLSLGSLLVPLRVDRTGLHVAVLTSATGFGADAAIASVGLPRGVQEIELPLHRADALRKVTQPVEVRLVFWGSKRGGYLGSFGDRDRTDDVILRGAVE